MSQALITDDDKTPLVGILVWVFLVLAILAVTARVATKLMIIRTLALDDFLIIVSTVRNSSHLFPFVRRLVLEQT